MDHTPRNILHRRWVFLVVLWSITAWLSMWASALSQSGLSPTRLSVRWLSVRYDIFPRAYAFGPTTLSASLVERFHVSTTFQYLTFPIEKVYRRSPWEHDTRARRGAAWAHHEDVQRQCQEVIIPTSPRGALSDISGDLTLSFPDAANRKHHDYLLRDAQFPFSGLWQSVLWFAFRQRSWLHDLRWLWWDYLAGKRCEWSYTPSWSSGWIQARIEYNHSAFDDPAQYNSNKPYINIRAVAMTGKFKMLIHLYLYQGRQVFLMPADSKDCSHHIKDNLRVYCSPRRRIIPSRTRFLKYCVCAI